MEAKVNEGCISCGACVAACPEVFRFNDDGEAEGKNGALDEEVGHGEKGLIGWRQGPLSGGRPDSGWPPPPGEGRPRPLCSAG